MSYNVQKCQARIICGMASFWIFGGSIFGCFSIFLMVHEREPMGAVVLIICLIPMLIGCSLCYCVKTECSHSSNVTKENTSNMPKLERIVILPAQVSHIFNNYNTKISRMEVHSLFTNFYYSFLIL